jgi:hypothetical protein
MRLGEGEEPAAPRVWSRDGIVLVAGTTAWRLFIESPDSHLLVLRDGGWTTIAPYSPDGGTLDAKGLLLRELRNAFGNRARCLSCDYRQSGLGLPQLCSDLH